MTTTATKRIALALSTAITLSTSGIIGYSVLDHAYASTRAPSVHAPASTCEENQPCWDCRTMGNPLCGSDYATWDEPNAAMPSGYERIYGQLSQMPAGSIHIQPMGQH